MIPIIIMNHGLFGKELIATAEMVVGKLEEVQAVSLMPGMTLEDYLEQSEVAVNQAGGKAIVLTDLYGGTPCNVAMMLRQRYELKVICGMNLPMLLELAGERRRCSADCGNDYEYGKRRNSRTSERSRRNRS